MTRFVAYIDILGARYWSKVSQDAYRITLQDFQRTILDKAYLLRRDKDDSRLYCFNDCAYAEATSVENLVTFLQSVRQELAKRKTYVKGALAFGSLTHVGNSASGGTGHRKGTSGKDKYVTFELLDGDAIKVYALADGLKGIGFRVDDSLVRTSEMRGRTVKSCYVSSVASSAIECFDDLRYLDSETTPARLGATLAECYRINSEEPSGGRYFVSCVVTFVRSLDWTLVDPFAEDKISPMVQLLLHRGFWNKFADLPGINAILGCLLHEAVESAGTQAPITKLVFERLGALRGANRRAAKLPHCLISRHAKAEFLEFLSQILPGGGDQEPESGEKATPRGRRRPTTQ